MSDNIIQLNEDLIKHDLKDLVRSSVEETLNALNIYFTNLAPLVREMETHMETNEIVGYESLVNDLKQLINKKQYHVLQMINAETINLYWEIGEEIYRQQEENGWGKSIVQVLSKELQKEFPGAKGYSAANLWRMRNF